MFCTVSGLQVVRMFQSGCPGLSFHIFFAQRKFWHLTVHTTLHMCRQRVKPPYAEELTVFPDAILRSRASHCPFSVLGLKKTA